MALTSNATNPKYLKALELLRQGLHPADIANTHVDYDPNTIRKIAKLNGIKYVHRPAGVREGTATPWALGAAYRQVQKGQTILQAASTYRVNPKRLRAYVAKKGAKVAQQHPVESDEAAERQAYFRRHAANLRWFQGPLS